MNQEQRSFGRFLKNERAAAAQDYVNGDATRVTRTSTTRDPATFLGPGGGIVAGARRVIAHNERAAKGFAPGGRTHFKVVQSAAAGGLAFWTGFQMARAKLTGKPGLVPMKLRVTEVFRRERRTWKLIHRHADLLAKHSARK